MALPKDPIVLELPTAIMANGDNGKAVEAQEPTAVMQQATNPPPTVVEELVISEEELKAQEEWNTFLANLPTSINTINLTLIALTNFANELEPRITALESRPEVATQNIGSVDEAAVAAQIAEIDRTRIAEFRSEIAATTSEIMAGFRKLADDFGTRLAKIETEMPQIRAGLNDTPKKSAVTTELGQFGTQLKAFGQKLDSWSKVAENWVRTETAHKAMPAQTIPLQAPAPAPTTTTPMTAPITMPSWAK